MHEVKWRGGATLKPFKFMEARFSRHKRSNSDPIERKVQKHKPNSLSEVSHHLKLNKLGMEDCVEAKKGQPTGSDAQDSLRQEILELQDQLQDQYVVRCALEKALSCTPFTHDIVCDKSIPKPAKELIKEIAVLELEVLYLERYLLSMYRKTFHKQVSSLPFMDERLESNAVRHRGILIPVVPMQEDNPVNQSGQFGSPRKPNNSPEACNRISKPGKFLDSSIQQCHSSLSHRWTRNSPSMEEIARATDSYHSLPLSMLEQAQNDAPNATSLAHHLSARVLNDVQETPNWLSEEMVKRISAIYCEIADPPLVNPDYPSSPVSFSSSINEFPAQVQGDLSSPECGHFSSFNSSVDNPFHIGEPKEYSGPYCTMAKVQWIRRDSETLRDIQHKLQEFRALVSRLETVDLRKMKHAEKLAFWINVHNALVMHAYLIYGIQQNNMKRMSLVLKAAYNVGGQTINVDMIQNSILGCRVLRPGQWLRQLFASKTKFKVGDAGKAYSIDHPEPRLHFALCSGSYSDPVVRVYTPKRVFEDLEVAKEEYIQSTFIVHKEKRLLLPKLVESFAKDSELCPAGLVETIEHLLPDSLRRIFQQLQHRKFGKGVDWIPHNFAFRYLLSKELAY